MKNPITWLFSYSPLYISSIPDDGGRPLRMIDIADAIQRLPAVFHHTEGLRNITMVGKTRLCAIHPDHPPLFFSHDEWVEIRFDHTPDQIKAILCGPMGRVVA